MKITPEVKDKVLETILLNSPEMRFRTNNKALGDYLNIAPNIIGELLPYFQRRGFILVTQDFGDALLLKVQVELHD